MAARTLRPLILICDDELPLAGADQGGARRPLPLPRGRGCRPGRGGAPGLEAGGDRARRDAAREERARVPLRAAGEATERRRSRLWSCPPGKVPMTNGRRWTQAPMRSSGNHSTRRIWRLSSKRSSLRSVVARVIAVSALGAAAIGATLGALLRGQRAPQGPRTPRARTRQRSARPRSTCAGRCSRSTRRCRVSWRTTRPDNVAHWRRAARAWEQPAAALERAAAASNAQQARRAHALREEIRSYINDYGEPVVGIAKVAPSAVRIVGADHGGRAATRRRSSPTPMPSPGTRP